MPAFRQSLLTSAATLLRIAALVALAPACLADPVIGLSVDSLAAQVVQGQNAESAGFSVSNAGTGTLSYTLTNDASWLVFSPASGSASGQPVSHTVSFITSNLPSGAYSSRLAVIAPGATPALTYLPVAVRIHTGQGTPPSLAPGLAVDVLDIPWLLLTWTSPGMVLAQSDGAAGPWTNSFNQAGAQLLQPSAAARFYRLQTPPAPPAAPPVSKKRVIHLTDLGADPDDQESVVHVLATANNYDIEGLVAVTSCWRTSQSSNNMAGLLYPILNAYGQVLTNLQAHAAGYPSLAYLQSISRLGQTGFGMAAVGAGLDSPGSELIIAAVDKPDPRPVWVNVWGGANTLAQALWKVRNTRTQAELDQFIGKLRVYDVLGQDDAGAWMAKTFTNLFYIRFLGVYNWQPSDAWTATNIQNHGVLGAVYPNRAWAFEGDSPSFFYEYPNNLSDPEHPDWGGWGGRCASLKKSGIRGMTGGAVYNEAQYDPYYMYGDAAEGGASIGRWSVAIQNDFAARMDWSATNVYSAANHHPVAIVNNTTNDILQITAPAGTAVALSAAGSYDPDNNGLVYSWFYYKEPGSYTGTVTLQNSATATPTVLLPSAAAGKTLHVILELHDTGSPNLYAYRRVIFNVTN